MCLTAAAAVRRGVDCVSSGADNGIPLSEVLDLGLGVVRPKIIELN